VRDPRADHLITPENAAFLLIDHQPAQLATIRSMDPALLVDRVIQAGGQPISWVSLPCELQRDWVRQDTVPAIVQIVLTDRLLNEQ